MGNQNKSINGIRVPDFLQTDIISKRKLNSYEITKTYSFLVKLYGEVCSICGDPPEDGKKLDIEHIDENPKNHHWKNLQLAHHSCNCKKRSEIPSKRKGAIRIPIAENLQFQNGESRLKKVYFTSFLNFVEAEFTNTNEANYKTFLVDAAAVCGFASEETIKRYTRMLCSDKIGLLERITDQRTGIEYLRKKGSFEGFREKFKW